MLLNHKWIQENHQIHLNIIGSQPIPLQDQVDIFNRICRYAAASDFNKMLTSLAIGLGYNSQMKECTQKIEKLFYQYEKNPNSTLTYLDFVNVKADLVSNEDLDNENLFKQDDLQFLQVSDWRTSVFDKLDLDGDKRVDFHEFYSAAIDHKELFNSDTIDSLFKILDT